MIRGRNFVAYANMAQKVPPDSPFAVSVFVREFSLEKSTQEKPAIKMSTSAGTAFGAPQAVDLQISVII